MGTNRVLVLHVFSPVKSTRSEGSNISNGALSSISFLFWKDKLMLFNNCYKEWKTNNFPSMRRKPKHVNPSQKSQETVGTYCSDLSEKVWKDYH